MKIGKYWSIISIVIAVVFLVLKLRTDMSSYIATKEAMVEISNVYVKIVPLVIEPLLVGLIPLTLSIIGMRKQNNYWQFALGLNIFTIIYLIIPVGLLLAVL